MTMNLPFSRSEFLQVFATYNAAIWPFQLVAAVLGVLAVVLLFWRPTWADRVIAAVLSVLWLVMGIVYHCLHFSTINRAAYAFGVLFVLAGLVFLVEGVIRDRINFSIVPGIRRGFAALLIVYAFAVYPLIGLLITHPYPETPLFGVAPCPTTIFTLGLLLLASYPRPWIPAAIPILWCVIGGSAALLLGVPQDLGLVAAAAMWVAGFFVQTVRRTTS